METRCRFRVGSFSVAVYCSGCARGGPPSPAHFTASTLETQGKRDRQRNGRFLPKERRLAFCSKELPASLPDTWQDAWERPTPRDRPLQIVHGVDLGARAVASEEEAKERQEVEQQRRRAAGDRMRHYRDLGLGGIVCNVPFRDYMNSEEHWNDLVAVVGACHEMGQIVWLYDEQGYPSGAAGGLVLQENPAFEALELAHDATRDDPFVVRPAYEFTHASNNYYAARRYPNLLNDQAVRLFSHKDARAVLATIVAVFWGDHSGDVHR